MSASIPPVGLPKATVTVESNSVVVTVRAPLSPREADMLADEVNRAAKAARCVQGGVRDLFRKLEGLLGGKGRHEEEPAKH